MGVLPATNNDHAPLYDLDDDHDAQNSVENPLHAVYDDDLAMSFFYLRMAALVVPKPRHSFGLHAASRRLLSTKPPRNSENINVGHSRFLAESSSRSKWNETSQAPGNGGLDSPGEDFDTLPEGKGELLLYSGIFISTPQSLATMIGFSVAPQRR